VTGDAASAGSGRRQGGLEGVTIAEMRLDVLLEPERTGKTVAEVCRRYDISRETYYRYRRRYLVEGLKGLEDRSRKPVRSPQIHPELERTVQVFLGSIELRQAREVVERLEKSGADLGHLRPSSGTRSGLGEASG
jgi:transposase-like protein